MTGALLVAGQDVADLAGVEQRVVGGKHGPAWNAEDHVDPHPLKGQHEGLRAGDPDWDLVRVVRARCDRGLLPAGRLRGRRGPGGLHGGLRGGRRPG
jgi:hypothetical protein